MAARNRLDIVFSIFGDGQATSFSIDLLAGPYTVAIDDVVSAPPNWLGRSLIPSSVFAMDNSYSVSLTGTVVTVVLSAPLSASQTRVLRVGLLFG